jgi:hypothetical protein
MEEGDGEVDGKVIESTSGSMFGESLSLSRTDVGRQGDKTGNGLNFRGPRAMADLFLVNVRIFVRSESRCSSALS